MVFLIYPYSVVLIKFFELWILSENCCDDEKCEVHAIFAVVFPLLERRDLGCLRFTPA